MSKIVFVNRFFYPDYSATSQMLTDLAFDLASRGCAVEVIASRQLYEDSNRNLVKMEEVGGVRVRRVWSSSFGRSHLPGRALDYLTFYISASWRMWRTVGAGDVVVAKTDPPLISVLAAIVVKTRRAVLINWLQDLFPEVAKALHVKGIGLVYPFLLWLRNLSLSSARCNIVIGERMAIKLRSLGLKGTAVEVIHNWANGNDICPFENENNSLRSELAIGEKFVVGYSGNMGRAHEFETLLDVAQRLSSRDDIVFLFIGGGARREWIELEVKRRNLSNVIFMGYQPRNKLAQSLSLIDLHVITLLPELEGLIVPSKYYGIAAAGRPALFIGDPEGEIPVILRESSSGWSFNPGNADAIASHLASLAGNKALIAETGRNARNIFESKFDQSKAFSAWEEVLCAHKHIGLDTDTLPV